MTSKLSPAFWNSHLAADCIQALSATSSVPQAIGFFCLQFGTKITSGITKLTPILPFPAPFFIYLGKHALKKYEHPVIFAGLLVSLATTTWIANAIFNACGQSVWKQAIVYGLHSAAVGPYYSQRLKENFENLIVNRENQMEWTVAQGNKAGAYALFILTLASAYFIKNSIVGTSLSHLIAITCDVAYQRLSQDRLVAKGFREVS